MKTNNPFYSIILKYPAVNLAIIGIITVVFGFLALHLKFDTSLSAFVIRNDPDMIYYNKVKKIFETEETVFIAFKARRLFSKKDLTIIESLSKELEDIPHVRNVRSITNANLISTTPDSFEVRALVKKMPETEKESLEIKKTVTTNYLYLKDLASTDGRFGALLVNIENVPGEKPTSQVVTAIKKILQEKGRQTGLRFYLGGDAIINHSLGEYMKRDFFAFLLPTYLILTLLLIVTVGRLRDVVVSLITITISLVWTVGVIALLGKTLNNVTLGIIPLILCIALEDIYYLHNHYYTSLKALGNRREAFRQTLKEITAPCFFTSFTTVVGFASLMANNIKPILDFSIVGSLSVMFAFIIAIIFIPSTHLILGAPIRLDIKPKYKINPLPLINNVARFVYNRRRAFWVGIPFMFIIALIGIFRIHIETDHLSFFHKNSQVYQSTTFIENNIGGVSNLELTIGIQEESGVKKPSTLREIDKLALFLRRQKNVDKAMSIADFLKDMNRAMYDYNESYYRIPDTRGLVAQYLLIYSMSPRRNDVEKDFVDYPYRLGRILCRMSEHNSTAILKLVNKTKTFAANNVPGNLAVKVTSYPVIYSNMVDSLARGQIRCLVLVFFALFILTSIYFRSIKIGLLAMIPNMLPITFTLGFMGLTGITLNIATAMTAGIAIGLAMDDTTHLFTRFKQKFSADPDYVGDTTQLMRELGEPMMYSSFLMMAGYLVLVLSQFRLTVFFGFLCALTIFIALLSDLFITPWLLMTFKPKFK
jgi:hypothetical protein